MALTICALLLVTGLAGVSGAAQRPAAGGDELWVTHNGGTNARVLSAATSPDGARVFITGSTESPSSSADYATFAYDASTGETLWAKQYDGPGHRSDQARSVVAGADGSRVFVTGVSDGGHTTHDDYATIAYDAATGAAVWARRYNGPANGDDFASSLAASPDGTKVFVTGYSPRAGSGRDFTTVAYEASTGAIQWIRRYDGLGFGEDQALAVAVSPDGSTAFVTGWSENAVGAADYATVAYDAVTGSVRWARRYTGPGTGGSPYSLAASPDGTKVFVTGYSVGAAGSYDYATIAYDAATGATAWVRRYDGPAGGQDSADAVTASPDGTKVFVSGYSDGTASGPDYATIGYDAATGAVLWVSRYDGPLSNNDFVTAIAASPDGSKVFVTGYSYGLNSSYDFATAAYDASSGSLVWEARHNGPANDNDLANALAVSQDGSRVFVSGYSSRDISAIFATLAYEA